MKHWSLFSLVFALSTATIACSKKEEPKKEEKVEPQAKEEKPKPAKKVRIRGLAPDTPRSRGEAVSTPEDFEEEASRTVALENLEAELDRLEAEIAPPSN